MAQLIITTLSYVQHTDHRITVNQQS